MNRRRDTDTGSVTAFVSILAVALLMVAGMAYDGGSILTAHATARSHATKAARTAAQNVDVELLRSTGQVRLDPAAAEAAGYAYLATVGADGIVMVEGDTAMVTVTVVQAMRILPLPDRRVTAAESASATTAEEESP